MNRGTISFKEIMRDLWEGHTADIECVGCSISRNKGGDIHKWQGVKLHKSAQKSEESHLPNRHLESTEPYPYHGRIHLVLSNRDIRQIYKISIIKYNDKTVLI